MGKISNSLFLSLSEFFVVTFCVRSCKAFKNVSPLFEVRTQDQKSTFSGNWKFTTDVSSSSGVFGTNEREKTLTSSSSSSAAVSAVCHVVDDDILAVATVGLT